MNMQQKLRALADEIEANTNALDVQNAWALVGRLIGRVPVDQAAAAKAVQEQDLDAFVALLDQLEGKDTPAPAPAAPELEQTFATEDLSAAMRAFKKRLKLARLNDESRLGSKQLSGGKHSEIDAIRPPSEYPDAMWHHLAREGRLSDAGGGFYGLPG